MTSYSASLPCRFWGSLQIGAADDCWPWLAGCNSDGYGTIANDRTGFVATRLMREFMDGKPVPSGLHVCHSCDNPRCVNPKHLWVGTPRQNIQDMIAKGRRGSRPLRARCQRGHPFTNDNIIVEGDVRRCRICRTRNRRGGQNG